MQEETLQNDKDHEDFMIKQAIQNMHDTKTKLSLKERLNQQKLEKLNQNLMDRMEEKRQNPTSLVYKEGEKKKPQYQDGVFYKYTMPVSLAESIKRLKNPDLEKLKAAHVKATNLGPGVSQMTMDTFRLLKNDPIILNSAENKNILAKEGLAAKVDDLVKQRDEFNMQIKEYNDE